MKCLAVVLVILCVVPAFAAEVEAESGRIDVTYSQKTRLSRLMHVILTTGTVEPVAGSVSWFSVANGSVSITEARSDTGEIGYRIRVRNPEEQAEYHLTYWNVTGEFSARAYLVVVDRQGNEVLRKPVMVKADMLRASLPGLIEGLEKLLIPGFEPEYKLVPDPTSIPKKPSPKPKPPKQSPRKDYRRYESFG